MKDNPTVSEVTFSRPHQRAITYLIYGLTELYKSGRSKLFAYPETMIDEGQTSPAPDVMLVDLDTDTTQVIIEVTHTQGVKKDTEKLKKLMQEYDVPEGFVFNYKRREWLHFRLETGLREEKSSFCHAVGFDLDNVFELF